jgi:hypothetical protein
MADQDIISPKHFLLRCRAFIAAVDPNKHRIRFKDVPRCWLLNQTKNTKDYIQEPVTFFEQIGSSFKAATKALGGPRKWKKTLKYQAEV